MKKLIFISLALSFICLFVLSSCDSTDNNPPIDSNQQAVEGTSDDSDATDAPIDCQHTFGEWNTVKEATCKEEGKRVRSCSICAEAEEEVISKSETHAIVADIAVSATCKDTGLTEGSHCSVCNKVLVAQTVIPKTEDHTPITDAAIAASCKNTGLTEGSHCSVCNKVLVAQTVVPKTEVHSSSNWIIDVEATCKSEGEMHKECNVCKQVLESEKIEKSVTHTTLKNNVEMPSGSFCGDAGSCLVSVSCAVCGEIISSGYQDIPEKHSMANGTCQACGLPQSTTAGLYFGLNSDGKSYYVMPGRNFAGGNVVIGVYNNLSVTEVDFVGCDSLTSIVIGDCVEKIGSFEACFNLISVKLGDRIREIPEYAFRDCSKLSTITFGDGVEKIGENAFSGCSRLYVAYISGSHDWWCGGDRIYGTWIEKGNGGELRFADYLKQYPWEWYRE